MKRAWFAIVPSFSLVVGVAFVSGAYAQCGPTPQGGCLRVVAPLKSKVRIKNGGDKPSRSDIKWLWKRGPQAPPAQLGSPETGADDYALCIYDTGVLAAELTLPGGANWIHKVGHNDQDVLAYKFKDRPYPPHGVRKLKLVNKAGNAALIGIKASRELVPVPALPFATPEQVTVQLVNTAGGCWEGNFNAGEHDIARNTAELFKAKGD